MKILILVVALLALTLPGELEAVDSCYQCTTAQKRCNDPFDSATIKPSPCAGLSNACKKTKLITGGENAVIRTCAPLCVPADVSEGSVRTIISCCKTDNCNAGMMTSFSVIVIMTSLLMAYLAKARL